MRRTGRPVSAFISVVLVSYGTLPATVARYFLWLCFAALLGLSSCDSGGTCGPGEPCECHDGNDCYLSCEGSGCNESCHNQTNCGGVCDDHCRFECHDVNDCSVACTDACNAQCHNVVACGAIIGADSVYRCHDASRCGVHVTGPGSSVQCDHITTCEVVCDASCDVNCSNTQTCRVTCGGPDGPTHDCNGGGDCGC